MDPVHFTGNEVLEMAIRIEENGLKFYSDAAKASKSKEVRELFKRLSEEEGKHIKAFTDLKKLVPDEVLSWKIDPDSEEASLYLRALADTEVFDSDGGAKLARKVRSSKSALTIAIGMEKDSILFYNELRGMVRERDRVVLEDLIEEEKDHLRKLMELRKIL